LGVIDHTFWGHLSNFLGLLIKLFGVIYQTCCGYLSFFFEIIYQTFWVLLITLFGVIYQTFWGCWSNFLGLFLQLFGVIYHFFEIIYQTFWVLLITLLGVIYQTFWGLLIKLCADQALCGLLIKLFAGYVRDCLQLFIYFLMFFFVKNISFWLFWVYIKSWFSHVLQFEEPTIFATCFCILPVYQIWT
jgi:hypothetical protein